MANTTQTEVTAVQPGQGEQVSLPGFGAVYKLTSPEVALIEHPFEVGSITAAHRHSREDERSIVIAGKIGFRSDDTDVVLEARGYITKPRGQIHAMLERRDRARPHHRGHHPRCFCGLLPGTGPTARPRRPSGRLRGCGLCTSCPNSLSWQTSTG